MSNKITDLYVLSVFSGYSLRYTITFHRSSEGFKNDTFLQSEEMTVYYNKPFVFL